MNSPKSQAGSLIEWILSPPGTGGANDFCVPPDLCLTLFGQLVVSYVLTALFGIAIGVAAVLIWRGSRPQRSADER